MTEAYLAARVLDALVREDYGGLAGRVEGDQLRLPGGRTVTLTGHPPQGGGGRYPGFLADRVVAEPVGLAEVLAVVRALADPRDDVSAFERECAEALRALRLSAAVRPRPRGITRYEALAATVDHPVYPTARCRLGLDERDLLAYAPEYSPAFPLRWTAVEGARCVGERPAWWPAPADLGLPDGQDVFPVHPLTARLLPTIPGPPVMARPTLSMRTVVTGTREHLKLPLPTSTLGLRNRRVIMPGTLEDGALVERVLRAVLAREHQPVLLADEQTHGHCGDPLRGYLVRRLPADGVPVAALLARTPEGRYVIEELTSDVPAFFRAYLDALFGWNVLLATRYGIALETHQQNVSIVPGDKLGEVSRRARGVEGAAVRGAGEEGSPTTKLGKASRRARGVGEEGSPTTQLRLMIKDNDGALLDLARLRRSLGHAPAPDDFADRRLLTGDPEALARVFVTITVHLCAGALAFGLAERGLLALDAGLALVRDSLAAALDAHDDSGFLRARTLAAERLPVKAMVTAGTLVAKDRTGAADINKHYGPPGPNYLNPDTGRPGEAGRR